MVLIPTPTISTIPPGLVHGRYFLPCTYTWDGENTRFTPESNYIPWPFVPVHKVTVEDGWYLLGSYYQGTPYNPYDKTAVKYRTIDVPNSDVCGIVQICGYLPEAVQGVERLHSLLPGLCHVTEFPKYLGGTTETISTDSIYWHNRLIATLAEAQFGSALILDERYQIAVVNLNRAQQSRYEYDGKSSRASLWRS